MVVGTRVVPEGVVVGMTAGVLVVVVAGGRVVMVEVGTTVVVVGASVVVVVVVVESVMFCLLCKMSRFAGRFEAKELASKPSCCSTPGK